MTLYETPEHRASERQAADELAAAWQCRLVRFPSTCPVDYYAERDSQLVALVEIKSRNKASTDLPHSWLNADKWMALRQIAQPLATLPLLVVRFLDDVLLWGDLDELPILGTAVMGRTDRADPKDRRLAVKFPLDAMHPVRGRP